MKRFFTLFLVLMSIFSFAACSGVKEPIAGQEVKENVGNGDGSKAISIVLFHVPPTLDTGSVNEFNATRVNACIYDYLVDKDIDGNWVPSVATSWKQVDNTTWTFNISDQFVFQNGEPLEMEDIVFSLERLKTAPAASVYANGVAEATYEGQVLTIKLKKPDNSVIPQLLNAMFIVNKSYIQEVGEDGLNIKPIGTGPYKVSSYDPATKAVLTTWEGYPFEKPDIEQITVLGGADSSARYIMIETEAVQFGGVLNYLDGQRAAKDGRFAVADISDVGVAAIKFNLTKAPFNNANVRKALAYALDREMYCQVAQGSTPAYSMVAASIPESTKASTIPEYDLEKAKKLLAAEGYSTSSPLQFDVTTFMPETALEAYQSVLASIGVKMNINSVQVGAYTDAETSGNFEALYSRYVNRSRSPMEEVQYYVSWGSKNTTGYSNARVDELGKIIYNSVDSAEISKCFAELQEIAGEDLHMLPIMTPHSYWAYSKALENVKISPNGIFDMSTFVYNK